MMTMKSLEKKLQKADRKQAALYLFCNFVSLLLITAYSAMMFSPTVLKVLPEGGDSRKQMTAIFVLALFGCVVFTIYASFSSEKRRGSWGPLWRLALRESVFYPGFFERCFCLALCPPLWGFWRAFHLCGFYGTGFGLPLRTVPRWNCRLI